MMVQVFSMIVLFSCNFVTKECYQKEDVKIESYYFDKESNILTLSLKPKLESIYYLRGLNVSKQKNERGLKLNFVRSHIHSDPRSVDFVANIGKNLDKEFPDDFSYNDHSYIVEILLDKVVSKELHCEIIDFSW